MKKSKPKVKTTRAKKINYNTEYLTAVHLIKYNIYLLAKSIVFSSVLNKTQNIDEAANYAHAILMAFHDQDHRVSEPKEPKGE